MLTCIYTHTQEVRKIRARFCSFVQVGAVGYCQVVLDMWGITQQHTARLLGASFSNHETFLVSWR